MFKSQGSKSVPEMKKNKMVSEKGFKQGHYTARSAVCKSCDTLRLLLGLFQEKQRHHGDLCGVNPSEIQPEHSVQLYKILN